MVGAGRGPQPARHRGPGRRHGRQCARRAGGFLWSGPGKLAQSNAQQVRLVRQIIEGLGRSVATPDEAREILGLKGGDKVAF